VLARGGVASAYGPILADQSIEAREPLPVELERFRAHYRFARRGPARAAAIRGRRVVIHELHGTGGVRRWTRRTGNRRLIGSGFRFARDKQHARAIAGGIEMPIISIGRASAPGNNQITVRVPDALADRVYVEFYLRVDGELSNVVRLRFARDARR
jgi:hypothetical protein